MIVRKRIVFDKGRIRNDGVVVEFNEAEVKALLYPVSPKGRMEVLGKLLEVVRDYIEKRPR